MADIFGDTGDWNANYTRFKSFHDSAYTKIDQGISLEHSGQIEGAVEKYDEGLVLIDKALAVPIDCPSNPDPTWERAVKMSDQMKRTKKEILSRLADIRASCPIPVVHCDDPDAPPSYFEACASSSSGSVALTSSSSHSINSTTAQSITPRSNTKTSNTSSIDGPGSSSTAGGSDSSKPSLYPSVPVNTWHLVPSYPTPDSSTSSPCPGSTRSSYPVSTSCDKSSSSSNTDVATTHEEQIKSSTHPKSRPITLSELGKALESVRLEISHQSAVEIFTCNNVAVCRLTEAGEVTITSRSEVLKIFLTEDVDNPHYYLQVGTWRYPLIKGVSPCVRTSYGAFLFPDIEDASKSKGGHSSGNASKTKDTGTKLNDVKTKDGSKGDGIKMAGHSLGLIVPDDCVEPLAAILEDILSVEIQYGKHQGTRPPSDLPETISRNIISGGNFISNALIKGAEKVEQALGYGTPRVIEKIVPNKEPTELPSKMKSGIKVTKNVSETAAKTTGYIANKVSSATVGLGRFLSPHVKKGGTALLTRYYGCQEAEASQTMDSVLTVGAGAVEGISAVYTGLEVAGAVLGRSLSDSTVKIVRHKYGQPAGEFTEDTFHTVGNVMEVNTNVRSLATKRLVKNTIKQTGKQVVLEHAKSGKESGKSVNRKDAKDQLEKEPK